MKILRLLTRLFLYLALFLLVCCVAAAAAGYYVAKDAYDGLPSLEALTDYRPKMPLRIYTEDKVLIGEFGDERRIVMSRKDVPRMMTLALLAAEDDRFYEHMGVDLQGIARAAVNNYWKHGAKQGASTITQQLARNFYLTREQTLKRKIYEALLALKIEHELSKDQILEIYMNQVFLGQRAYGFASASQIYFGKGISELSVAQYAMLAGLPKAPSAYNPATNPQRAKERQTHILNRMLALGYIDQARHDEALRSKLGLALSVDGGGPVPGAEYPSEMARQFAFDHYGEAAYSMGLSVYTTIDKQDEDVAVAALRHGVVAYDRSHGYRGPEGRAEIAAVDLDAYPAIAKALVGKREFGGMVPAIVLQSTPKGVKARGAGGREFEVGPEGSGFAQGSLAASAPKERRISRGSLIRVEREGSSWRIAQIPEVASSFISADTHDGSIKAVVGGFDFNLNKFNRAVQAYRQPGSSFKPFIYSASLEKGMSPSTIINDSAFFHDPGNGGPIWAPHDYDGKGEGPMTMRRALTLSKNLVSARIIDAIGPQYAQQYALRFGFDESKNPPVMALSLGAGAVTPIQMSAAYSAFANGGFKVEPHLVDHIVDQTGKTIYQAAPPKAGDEQARIIDGRNAFIMDSMLHDVATRGTAARASAELKRQDISGKTGTTNNAFDAWFCGYQPDIVGIAWVGFDQPKSLGSRETGGGLALPIWVEFMSHMLKDKPMAPKRKVPEGVIESGGDYFLSEFPPGVGIRSVGMGDPGNGAPSSGSTDSDDGSSSTEPSSLPIITNSAPADAPSKPPSKPYDGALLPGEGNVVHFPGKPN